MNFFQKFLPALFTVILCTTYLIAGPRQLSISGTKIHTEEELLKNLKLSHNLRGNISSYAIISGIRKFYKDMGYSIVTIYVLRNDSTELSLYVDEGLLGKIIFKNINSLQVLRAQFSFPLDKKIFNRYRVEENLKEIKKTYNVPRVEYKLIKRPSYSQMRFQLDSELELPVLGPTQLPFFDKFGPRYDLEIRLNKPPKSARKPGSIDMGLNIHYTNGFIPKVSYYNRDLIRNKDSLEAEVSAGIMYGIDGNFTDYPHMTFFQVKGTYYFAPWMRKYFTPKTKGRLYHSKASRSDIGISSYNYWQINGVLAPGITILERLKVYAGCGLEYITFRESEYDTDSDYIVYVEKEFDFYPYLETEIKLDLMPWMPGERIKRNLCLCYDRYFDRASFNIIEINGQYDFKLPDYDIYSIGAQYHYSWGEVPFHHEEAVDGKFFKGFLGKSYHTNHNISLSQEYRVSLYREYIYGGIYLDFTQFRGSEYDLSGTQRGIVAGPTLRYIILDQFEFFIGYGYDYLFSSKESQGNISLHMSKKW